MKTLLLSLTAVCALVPTTLRAFDDVKISPTPVRLAASRANDNGNKNVASKTMAYTVKVVSSSFKAIPNVTIKYNIFYTSARLGDKSDPEVQVSKGSHAIPLLENNRPVEFETESIKLQKASLDGGWYFANGASASTRDKVVGTWFKAFDATGKQIGEYINPSTLSNKHKWKE